METNTWSRSPWMCSRVLALSVALFLVLVPLISTKPQPHNIVKRQTFFDLNCRGVYNASIFWRLDRICEDCYSLFREPEIHHNCKKDCFMSEFFKGCVDALQLSDEVETFKSFIKQLNGGRAPMIKPKT